MPVDAGPQGRRFDTLDDDTFRSRANITSHWLNFNYLKFGYKLWHIGQYLLLVNFDTGVHKHCVVCTCDTADPTCPVLNE